MFKPVTHILFILTLISSFFLPQTHVANMVTNDKFFTTTETALTDYTNQAFALSDQNPATFNPGNIISDEEFYNTQSLTAEQIQEFLQKTTTCGENPLCLTNYTTSIPGTQADQYCSEILPTESDTAANIISKVATACKINPEVLLVMLQKEQSLITTPNPTADKYDKAMGQSCPDSGVNNTANCDSTYFGFFNQTYYAARQQQIYTQNPSAFNYKAGETNAIQWSPNAECGTTTVYIENQATANLYNYTPYVPNLEALTTLHGTGDACSAYGNRNFYVYYNEWFKNKNVQTTPVCSQPSNDSLENLNQTKTILTATPSYIAPTRNCAVNLTTIPANTTLQLTHQYGEWVKGTYNNQQIWVKLGLDITSCSTPPSTPVNETFIIYNTADFVNARQAPTTECETNITQIPGGTKVTATETTGDWYKISTETGSTYWVNTEYLTQAGPETLTYVTNSEVNFRTEPTTTAPSYGKLPGNFQVGQILEKQENWAKIVLGNRTGWVHTNYLTLNP